MPGIWLARANAIAVADTSWLRGTAKLSPYPGNVSLWGGRSVGFGGNHLVAPEQEELIMRA
jgi:hypothetical protein